MAPSTNLPALLGYWQWMPVLGFEQRLPQRVLASHCLSWVFTVGKHSRCRLGAGLHKLLAWTTKTNCSGSGVTYRRFWACWPMWSP